VAGITAALDLANCGEAVHLVEREATLGGQVSRLDKLYPTDHCAFCALWTEVRSCREHPLITVHTQSILKAITRQDDSLKVVIEQTPPLIDDQACIFCGRCMDNCPLEAIRAGGVHVIPPFYVINPERCDHCGRCVDMCPTGAIDLNRPPKEVVMTVRDVIWATGFQDADISSLTELGYGTHPDIMSALEFEEWIAEAGPNRGAVLKHDATPPKSIAFVQCAGARDRRMFPYCSAVCCMHALKQARWVHRRNPATRCTIFYTDLRTEGPHYFGETTHRSDATSLDFIRGRPGLIYPLPAGGGIAVKYENTLTQTREMRKFDMVVFNGALKPSLAETPMGGCVPQLDEAGFVDESEHLNLACGFCRAPAGIERSVVQASATALKGLLKKSESRSRTV